MKIKIERELKEELRRWCRFRQTTLVMSVFTAYVGLVLRWCNVPDAVIRYQSDGRFYPEIENTIGFFASALYLRITLLPKDSFIDLMNYVTNEFCQAYQHADFSYITAQVPSPPFTRNTGFNWVPQPSNVELSSVYGSEHMVACSAMHFAHPMLKRIQLDLEPSILLFDRDDEIVGGVRFPLDRFSVAMMDRFARNFLRFLTALVTKPEQPVEGVLLLQ